jgi:hypothetical protein
MSDGIEVAVPSGVSWLHDELVALATERVENLKDGIAEGVPLHEYPAMVGRYKEAKRQLSIVIPELFEKFYVADESEDSSLEELNDE